MRSDVIRLHDAMHTEWTDWNDPPPPPPRPALPLQKSVPINPKPLPRSKTIRDLRPSTDTSGHDEAHLQALNPMDPVRASETGLLEVRADSPLQLLSPRGRSRVPRFDSTRRWISPISSL